MNKLASERFVHYRNLETESLERFFWQFTKGRFSSYAGTQPASIWKRKMDNEVIMEALRMVSIRNYNWLSSSPHLQFSEGCLWPA